MEEYRRRSCVVGQEIDVLTAQGPRAARALDIGADGHLLVRYADGSKEKLYAGEIGTRVRDSRAPAPDNSAPSPDSRAPSPDNCAPSPDNCAPAPDNCAPAPDGRFGEGRA